MLVKLNISDNVLGYVFEKKLDQESVDALKKSILDKLETHNSISLYIEEDDTEDLNMKALMEEMLFNINHSNHFKKVAVVTNRDWVRGLAKLKGVFMDSELKTFTLDERLDAMSWLVNSSELKIIK